MIRKIIGFFSLLIFISVGYNFIKLIFNQEFFLAFSQRVALTSGFVPDATNLFAVMGVFLIVSGLLTYFLLRRRN